MTQSKELTEFYRAYLKWYESCAVDNKVFKRRYALCACLEKYLESLGCSRKYVRYMKEEMEIQFKKASLHNVFPFNYGSLSDYRYEKDDRHLNPRRIAWVQDHAMIDGEGGKSHA